MPRTARLERPGAWHHVTARGNERRAIFMDERDRRHFLGLVGETVELFGWRMHAYVLMDNHFHFLVETPQTNLGRGMQWLNTSYSVWFNRRHDRVGHLLQGRFKSVLVDAPAWGLALSRYIHLNPVRIAAFGLDKNARQHDRAGAGTAPSREEVAKRLQRLRGFRWSSYRAYLGLADTPAWLCREAILQFGGGRPLEATRNYRQFVEDAIRQGLPQRPWEQLRDGVILGGVEFARRVSRASGKGRSGAGRPWKPARATVAEIIAVVEQVKKEKWADFRDRHGDWGRDLVFHLGRKDWALPLRELGAAAGGVDAFAVSMAARRLPGRAQQEPTLRKALSACREKLQMLNV